MKGREIKRYKRQELKRRRVRINFDLIRQVLIWAFKIAIVCLLAFVAVLYFGQKVSVVGDSMSPVLKNNDEILVNRVAYNIGRPKRGDIIVFKPHGNNNSHYYIKRIVGLPGETLSIMENNIYIDGKKLSEDYKTTDITETGIVKDGIKLANDEFFVMGDNRKNSEDSRNADIGGVKREYIYGKVWFRISPDMEIVRSK